jgi:hypothetical protein
MQRALIQTIRVYSSEPATLRAFVAVQAGHQMDISFGASMATLLCSTVPESTGHADEQGFAMNNAPASNGSLLGFFDRLFARLEFLMAKKTLSDRARR